MPLLSEAARHLVYPTAIEDSTFFAVQDRLAEVGIEFDDWQQGLGQIALGLDASGEYAATIGGVVASIPRQVGKTFTVGSLLVGLSIEYPGLRSIWTSHHGSTTKNTLMSMQGLVRKPRIWAHVLNVYTNNNDLRIVFENGSEIKFGAREHGFGRGMDAVDMLVFDEAQKLGLKALEDMVPATNQARNPHGGLVFFIGTPPRPVDDCEVFAAKRAQALAGNPDDDMVFVEFSADPDASPDDRSQWPIMNPSYPKRTPLKSMLRMRKNLPDEDAWRREAMGIWDDAAALAIVPDDRWETLIADGPEPGKTPDSFGVAAHDGQFSVIACWADDEDRHLEEVFAHGRLDLVCDWLVSAARRRIPVLVPNYGAAAPLHPMLQAKRVNAKSANSGDVGRGCELLVEGCKAGWLTHADQVALADSIAGARKKLGRDGAAWTYDLKTSTQNAPAMGMALALAGAAGVRRPGGSDARPKRKAVIG